MLNPAIGGTSKKIKNLRDPETILKVQDKVQGDKLGLFTTSS
jgi:hypothetical protein